jgi:hypothetical protein
MAKNKKNDSDNQGLEVHTELARFPVPVRPAFSEITELYAPASLTEDEDLQQRLVPIGTDAGTDARRRDSYTRSNEIIEDDPSEFGSKAGSPDMWSIDPGVIIKGTKNIHGKIDPGTASSKSVECDRCGKLISPTPSSAKIVFSPKKGKSVAVCRYNCTEWKGIKRY